MAQLAAIRGLQQLVLTTNGLQLVEMVDSLRQAGVQRLNISLDSLRPTTFADITRGADLEKVQAEYERVIHAELRVLRQRAAARREGEEGEGQHEGASAIRHAPMIPERPRRPTPGRGRAPAAARGGARFRP